MADLTASAAIRGRAIDLALVWSDQGATARSLRVVRRRRGYPTGPDDGLVLVDLTHLFRIGDVPWGRIDRARFLLINTQAEGGLLQAEIAQYYVGAGDADPIQVTIFVHGGSGSPAPITSVVQVTTTVAASTTTFEVFTQVSPGLKSSAGRAVISTQGGGNPNLFTWIAGTTQTSAPFVVQEVQSTVATVLTTAALVASFVTTVGSSPIPIRTIDFMEEANPDTGDLRRSIAITDREPAVRTAQGFEPGLQPGITYYYAAFEDLGSGIATGTIRTASAVATSNHGFGEKLYQLLPAIHRYYDDPAGGAQGTWQLRRLLQIFGSGLDQTRSLGEGLSTLHDIFEVRADFLPHLGQWIGWEVDRTLPTQRQRADILSAPDVFATLGTVPNIEALVHRSTGWTCKAKEFVNNVFLTNAVESIQLWEIWQAPPVQGVLTLPVTQALVTPAVNDSIDARPAVAAQPSGGAPWLFWHSKRTDTSKTPPSERRQIWMQRLDGSGQLRPVMQGAPDDGPNVTFSDEWPAAIADGSLVRLFWSSNRGGSAGIWTRTLTNGVPSDATQLTKHPAGDHCPAVVKDKDGTLWLFWHSSRRGPIDIWAMMLAPNATKWSAPRRITSGRPHDRMPVAFVDSSNQLRLLWSADFGDRSRIVQSILNGTAWSTPIDTDVSSGSNTASTFRDEAPAAALLDGKVWVFWSSNRDGIFRLWASVQTSTGWSPPVTVTTGRHEEKEPAVFIDDGGALRLFFRTQQSGEAFRSRTVDFSDLDAIKRGQVEDRWHYTYSIATDEASYYARDTVGLYITPDQEANLDEAERVKELVEPFRPLSVRFVWFVEPAVVVEALYGSVDIGESYQDVFPYVDHLGAIGETSTVSIPQWNIFHTNKTSTPGDVTAKPGDPTTLWHRVFYPAPT